GLGWRGAAARRAAADGAAERLPPLHGAVRLPVGRRREPRRHAGGLAHSRAPDVGEAHQVGRTGWTVLMGIAVLRDEAARALAQGAVIPAHPPALTAQRKLDDPRPRALTRY